MVHSVCLSLMLLLPFELVKNAAAGRREGQVKFSFFFSPVSGRSLTQAVVKPELTEMP